MFLGRYRLMNHHYWVPVQCRYYSNLVQHLSSALEGPHTLSTGNAVTDVHNIQSCMPYFSLFKSIPVTLILVIYDCHAWCMTWLMYACTMTLFFYDIIFHWKLKVREWRSHTILLTGLGTYFVAVSYFLDCSISKFLK